MSTSNYFGEIVNPSHKSVFDLTCEEVIPFFLKRTSYCNLDLPYYYVFDHLLADAYSILKDMDFFPLSEKATKYEDVNYTILNNKDGCYAWRPMQFIHPVLYISLLKTISQADNWQKLVSLFKEYGTLTNIRCASLPVVSLTVETDSASQVSKWIEEVEQKSFIMAIEYEYITHTDITDCYSSIYTHTAR